MGDFAVIAEGYTDQVVIRHVLLGIFGDADDEPVINFEQPRLDETGRKGAHEPGGWSLVIKYLAEKRYLQALQLNAYLVVHIDTDVAEDYGLKKPADGQEAELLRDVAAMFERLIGDDIWRAHGERFIFATAVHSLECWLLPLLFPDQKARRAKLAGCLDAANDELRRQGRPLLTRGAGKDPAAYRAASAPYRKRKLLLAHVDHNLSLTHFVREVERRQIKIPAEPA